MYYYCVSENDHTQRILLSTAYDSIINIYNEENPEETEKLRTLRGGHTLRVKILEISYLAFSEL